MTKAKDRQTVEKLQVMVINWCTLVEANIQIEFAAINETLLMHKLNGKPLDFNLIQVYMPTTDHIDEKVEELHKQIKELEKMKRTI